MNSNTRLVTISMLSVLALAICIVLLTRPANASSWRDPSNRAVLKNSAMEAVFQSGMICSLKDRTTGKMLQSVDPGRLPSQLLIFDAIPTDLDTCQVTNKASGNSVITIYRLPNGDELRMKWSIEKGRGDLVLRVSSTTAKPISQIRYTLFGCGIVDNALVTINAYGAGNVVRAPWNDVQIGDPQRDGTPAAYPHPVVALFQAEDSGWFIEGRDPRPGPANLMAKGFGDTVNIGLTRMFPIAKQNPDLYEIRIRTYKGHWEDAVDPYISWLEKGAGFVPIDKLPKGQSWVRDIRTQAYVNVGDYDTLEAKAKYLNPKKTFIGRQGNFRPYSFDVGYPDYRLTDEAKKWVRRVRELRFHVGLHFNCNGVGTEFPELVEHFKPGFAVTGKDANGNDTYQSIYEGRLIRCSAAYKPWRDYLIAQMKDAVDAGVDVIYLDESMTSTGKYVVDGVDGIQGMLALMRETLQTYPHVAVETEQFNLLTAKYGKFALSQMPLGHPLAGYIFQRYVKVVPEGIMYGPKESNLLDAFDYWGYMLPGAGRVNGDNWDHISQAYQKYDLVPDGRLPRKQFTVFGNHPTGGVIAVYNEPAPPEGEKLFGLRGSNGVTAYFEKHANRRGLVVYESGKAPQWVATSHFGIKSWSGPGVPVWASYKLYRDWLIYDDTTLYGLDPSNTYIFDETVNRSPTRFHITRIPDDYVGCPGGQRCESQEVGKDDSFFKVAFAGHGNMTMFVPDEYDVYLDGRKLDVDRTIKMASATINASLAKSNYASYHIELKADEPQAQDAAGEKPSMLLAYKRSNTELVGKWLDLPWQRSADVAKPVVASGTSLHMNAGAFAIFIGKLPQARSIRLQGSYIVSSTTSAPGDGVVVINGTQALRVPAGSPPYQMRDFDADISAYAGQDVLMEVISDGVVSGAAADWVNSRIVVEK